MNFLRNKSLKQSGIYLLVLMLLVYLAQYWVVRQKVDNLDQAERKIDFVRSTQLSSQQITQQVQLYLKEEEKEVSAKIMAGLRQQDHLLKTIEEGGRIQGTDHFIDPLSRLPKITFDALMEHWKEYKNTVLVLISEDETTLAEQAAPTSVVADSLSDSTVVTPAAVNNTSVENPNYKKAVFRYEGLWLSLTSWYDKLIVDLEEEVVRKNNAITHWLVAFSVLDILLLGVLFFLFARHVLSPIKTLAINAEQYQYSNGFKQNEIGHVANAINGTIENLRDATDFVTAIGEGNLSIAYKRTHTHEQNEGSNKLAESLINMQAKLKELNEEERKRQWANEGFTKFVEIVRSSNDSLQALGDKIISALVQYTHANQGGLYILNDEDERNKYLELISLFAFDIKKHEKQRIKLGEGFLGQAFLEKETTYLTDLPAEYIRITSGLGDASPRVILIVPLKVDQHVYGLVELASFTEYQPHEIAFVEKLGETIASTLASVRAAQKNRNLIEQFQQQTEQMRAQEEEMRQNMEELQATQEEVARKERSYILRIQELEEQIRTLPLTQAQDKEALKEEFSKKEEVYRSTIQRLEQQLSQAPVKGDDWALALEIENALKINLEALKITEEELRRKG